MRLRSVLRLPVLSLILAAVCLQGGIVHGEVAAPASGPKPAYEEDGISVYFSPGGGCTEAIVQQINQAKETIQVQAYSFTSAEIAKALLDAHKRGVKVTALLDASQRTAQYSSATFLFHAGIPVFIDANHAIAHNKIILLDGRTIITGSFNFTKAAEQSNAENLLIMQGRPGLYATYENNFTAHLSHAVQYEGPKQPSDAVPQGPPDARPTAAQPPVAPPARAQSGSGPSPAGSSGTAAATADGRTVHVTKSGRKYHREGCTSLAKSDFALKLSEAKAKGYTPCARCQPPP